jgi:acyl carrier protein
MEELRKELRVKIGETLNLVDVTPEDIEPDGQLVGGDLGIDSIDILELVMMIEKDYSVKIDSKELGAEVFASLNSLAEHIRANSPKFAA